jgi:endonuclease YncB( thermonuclease family)
MGEARARVAPLVRPDTGGDGACPSSGSEAIGPATVTDGATLALADGSTVRLAGIDAPAFTGEDAGSGPAAALLRDLLAKGAAMAPAGTAPDRYGRRPAWVFAGERSVQEALLAAGLARARWYPGETDCLAAFLAAERPARAANLGLWAAAAYAIRQADDPSLLDQNGLYAVVEGKVVSVGHGSRMTFLDFGAVYRRDFTVMLTPAIAEKLVSTDVEGGTGKGGGVDAFANHTVRVRGVIEESGGPAIRLNDPAEIELIDTGDGQ